MKSNGAVRRLLKKVLGNSILNFSTNKKDGYNKVNLVNVLASEEQVVSALERMTTELNECCPPGATIDEKDGALSDIWYAAHKFEELDGSKKAAFQNFLTAIFSSDAFKKQTGSGRLNKERLMRKYDLGLNPSGKKFKEPKPMQGGQAYRSEPVPSDTLNRHETQKAGSALIPSNLSNEQGKGYLESSAHPDAFMSNQGLPIVISTPDMMTDISSAIPTGDMKYNTSIRGHRAETDMKIMKGMPTNKTQGYRSTHTYLPPVPEYATQSATRQSRDIAMAEAADSQLTTGRGNATSSGQAQLNITSFQSTGQGTGGRTTMGGTPGTDPELPPLPSNRITTASPEKGDPNVAQVVSSSPTEPGTAPVDPGKEAATKDTGRDTGKSEGQNGFMEIDLSEQSLQNYQKNILGAMAVGGGVGQIGLGLMNANPMQIVAGGYAVYDGIQRLTSDPPPPTPQPTYVDSQIEAPPPSPQQAPDKTETTIATPIGENDQNAILTDSGETTGKKKTSKGGGGNLRGQHLFGTQPTVTRTLDQLGPYIYGLRNRSPKQGQLAIVSLMKAVKDMNVYLSTLDYGSRVTIFHNMISKLEKTAHIGVEGVRLTALLDALTEDPNDVLLNKYIDLGEHFSKDPTSPYEDALTYIRDREIYKNYLNWGSGAINEEEYKTNENEIRLEVNQEIQHRKKAENQVKQQPTVTKNPDQVETAVNQQINDAQKSNIPAGNPDTVSQVSNQQAQQQQQQQPTQPVPSPTIPQDKTGQPAKAGTGVVNGMTIDTDQENGQGVGPLGSRVENERYKQADAYLPTLRLFFQEGDANIVTRINENPYAKMLDRKEWNELSDYDWEANNERNNPLYTYNLIDEARRFSGKLAGEELMPVMASEATQESYNKYPKEMFMETKEVTQDSDSIVLDVRGGAPLRPLSADETEAGFRDVYMKAWIDIPETSGWKKFTQVQGSQMSDSQIRDPNHLHVNDAYAEADENMFIYTTDM